MLLYLSEFIFLQEKKPKSFGSDDLTNDDELLKSSPIRPAPKKEGGRSKKLLATNDSDDSDFGATVAKQKKPKKISADKPPAAKKAKHTKPKTAPKKKAKKPAPGESSDEGSGSDTNFDISDVGPARDRPGRTKTISKYNFGTDSEDEFA